MGRYLFEMTSRLSGATLTVELRTKLECSLQYRQTGTQRFGLARLSTISLGGQLTLNKVWGHCNVEVLVIGIGLKDRYYNVVS